MQPPSPQDVSHLTEVLFLTLGAGLWFFVRGLIKELKDVVRAQVALKETVVGWQNTCQKECREEINKLRQETPNCDTTHELCKTQSRVWGNEMADRRANELTKNLELMINNVITELRSLSETIERRRVVDEKRHNLSIDLIAAVVRQLQTVCDKMHADCEGLKSLTARIERLQDTQLVAEHNKG